MICCRVVEEEDDGDKLSWALLVFLLLHSTAQVHRPSMVPELILWPNKFLDLFSVSLSSSLVSRIFCPILLPQSSLHHFKYIWV